MYTFIAPSLPFLPKRSNNPNVAYIVSAFKTLGGLDALDQTWSIWSGADFIAANAPPALKLQRLTLHKRTDLRGTFTYVLICELSEGLADVMRTREFIEKIKCRECGFTSLFAVDHFFWNYLGITYILFQPQDSFAQRRDNFVSYNFWLVIWKSAPSVETIRSSESLWDIGIDRIHCPQCVACNSKVVRDCQENVNAVIST